MDGKAEVKGELVTMVSSSGAWPSHFPSCCPPSDARDLNDRVYYLVSSFPVEAKDMLSAKERDVFKSRDECQRAALSCYLAYDHIVAVRQTVPRLRSYRVAEATLEPRHGKIKQTGQTKEHHSMWLCVDTIAAADKLFREAT